MVTEKIRLFGSLIVLALLALMPVEALAQVQKIAIVDIQRLMSESKAAISIQTQLQNHRETFQDEFSRHERDLSALEKTLGESRGEMSPEEFNEKRLEFEGQLLETRKLVQKRRRALEEAAGEALDKLRGEIVKIVAGMAEKEEYDMVITRQNVILAEKSLDITDDVMQKLDSDIEEIKLKIETN